MRHAGSLLQAPGCTTAKPELRLGDFAPPPVDDHGTCERSSGILKIFRLGTSGLGSCRLVSDTGCRNSAGMGMALTADNFSYPRGMVCAQC
jgi:hypothetical protein